MDLETLGYYIYMDKQERKADQERKGAAPDLQDQEEDQEEED